MEQLPISVYFRKDCGGLGQIDVNEYDDLKDAILKVKESLVADGDCLTNKPVLALLKGGTDYGSLA